MNSQTTMPTVILGRKELEQSIRANIRTILLTSSGEIPYRPQFGLGAERLLGGGVKSIDIAYEVVEQLKRYEPRIKVKQVTKTETSPGHINVAIRYEIIKNGVLQTIIFNN